VQSGTNKEKITAGQYKINHKSDLVKSAFRYAVRLIADYAAIVLSIIFAVYVRNALITSSFLALPDSFVFIIIPLAYICIMYMYDLYVPSIQFWDIIERIFKSCLFAAVFAILFQYARQKTGIISRLFIPLFAFFSFILLVAMRYVVRKITCHLSFFKPKVLLVGDGNTIGAMFDSVQTDFKAIYDFIGVACDDVAVGSNIAGYQVLCSLDDLEKKLSEMSIQKAVIVRKGLQRGELRELVYRVQPYVETVAIIPDFYDIPIGNISLESFYDDKMMLMRLKNNLAAKSSIFVKDVIDVLLSIPIVVISLPIMLIIAVLVRLDSEGPVLYSGLRVGKHGKLFKCYKFRSMYVNEKEILIDYLSKHTDAQQEWDEYHKLCGDDPRVTKIGRFLRKTSLDELPQIFNVVKDEMSLVGPRPYLPNEDLGGEGYIIQMVKPGITGLWQTSGRNAVTFDERLEMESWYVRNWSVWMDIVIMFRTIKVVLLGKGAY